MKCIAKWVLSAAVAALAAGAADAQGQRGGGQGRGGFGFGFGGTGPLQLVVNKDVLDDIKATDEQKTKLADWQKEAQPKQREQMQEKFAGLQDLPMEERPAKMASIMAEMNKGLWKDVEGVLKPDQVTRLKQIELQAMGLRAFTTKDVTDKLKLSEETTAKLKTIVDDTQRESMAAFQGLFTPGEQPDPDKMAEARKKQTELQKKGMETALAALSADQKKAFEELKGKEFDVAKLQVRPMRRDM